MFRSVEGASFVFSRTPESGLVTAALKIKRAAVDAFYEADLDRMYEAVNGAFSPRGKKQMEVPV